MDSFDVHAPRLPQTSQGAHPQNVASYLFFNQSPQFKKLNWESQKSHELQIEKKEKQNVPCELGNIPTIPILPLERFQWALAQACEHGGGIKKNRNFQQMNSFALIS